MFVSIPEYIGPFPAQTTGGDWNGWARPTFDFETACDVMLAVMEPDPASGMLPGFASYDPESDTFWVSLNGDIASIADVDNEYDVYTHDADGRYPIGTDGWCWETVDIDRLASMLAEDIRDNVSAEDWANMQVDIARDPHNIRFPIDTNECMVAVWLKYFGREPDATSDNDSAVWNAVWTAAVAGPLREDY